MKSDSERLCWLVDRSALIRTTGENSPNPEFFIVYNNGTTSDSRTSFRETIDAAMIETKSE